MINYFQDRYHIPNRVLWQFDQNSSMKVIPNANVSENGRVNVKAIWNMIDLDYDPCFDFIRGKNSLSRTSNSD
jgi:hypothetical protein